MVAGVAPQPEESLGKVYAHALCEHALGLLDHYAAGQSGGELLVQALGFGAGALLHDADAFEAHLGLTG